MTGTEVQGDLPRLGALYERGTSKTRLIAP
jgi:hypothetical protein